MPKTLSVDDLADVLGPPPNGKEYAGDQLLDAIDKAAEDLTVVNLRRNDGEGS